MKENKSNIDSFNSENHYLSIRLSLDGFSFCVKNHLSGNVEFFNNFSFKEKNSFPSDYLEKIKDVYKQETILSNTFKGITVSHFNQLATQVPAPFFKEKHLKNYLQHTVKVLDDDYVAFDIIKNSEIVNVYIPFVNINNFLIDQYGSFIFKHSSTVLIEKLKHFCTEKVHNVFVNVHTTSIEVVVFKHKSFTLYNCFNYQTENDFIYYILFIAEQLELDTKEFQLILLGEISKKSSLYNITCKYIQNISFYEPLQVPVLLNNQLPHQHFTLLNQL